MFANEKRPAGQRPIHSPRDPARINKRNQLKRDRENGLKRVELKVEAELLERLNQLALQQNISRAELIQSILKQQIESAFAVDIAV